jgi:hypothetical protein
LRQRAAALTCTARLGGMRHAAGLAEEQLPIARRATSRRARVQRDHRDNSSGSRRDEQAGKRRVAEPAQARADQTRPKGWAETAARGRLRGVEAALHGATPRRLPEHQRAEAALKGHEIGSTRNMNDWLGHVRAWSWPSRRRYADPASFLLTPARWELQRSDHALPATGSARFLGRWWPTSDLQDGLGPLVHL